MKSPSLGKYPLVDKDKYYSIDERIGLALNMDLPDHEFTYIEPCCGGGDLMAQIKSNGKCIQAIDIEPEQVMFQKYGNILDVGDARHVELKDADVILTNPPFSRQQIPVFHEMLKRFIDHGYEEIYMVLPFNFAANLNFEWAMKYCDIVRPTGRLKWFNDGRNLSDTKDHAIFRFRPRHCDTILKTRPRATK